MSDPVNGYPAAGQNQQQPYGQPQQAYGQPAYALNPEIEKIRSNASTARMLSFVSFLFGHLLLAGGMWIWTNKLVEEAKILGAPMDVMADVESARSAAKICSIIQLALLAAVFLFVIVAVVIGVIAGANS
ncbi:hypothetical protein [Actinomyces sp. HMSC035G02]|uniref:hypothetical protein n=1 Tax=Actinomyces sp. HMSC035G02 TaxID=1739406 RepID=UPI0008A836B8|nr:hypothetical protein [Actinomyces sp. HMSC035G02]OHR18499.1 hypothetical protein HMPREF2902_04170 [Actinomyces sp. HMSC035G02]